MPAAVSVSLDEVCVRICRLWILVEVFHVGVGGRAVKIKIAFLYILAMIAFAVSQSEKPLFDDRILAIPECKSKTEILLVVGKTGDAVFAPAIGARACMVVWEVIPGSTKFAVVLPHSSPLPLT